MATGFPPHQVIIVGGGISGLCAAASVLESGGSVLLLERMASCGGNSSKAASGFSAAGTPTQQSLSISDSVDLFFSNIMESGGRDPSLVRALTSEASDALNWLHATFGISLSTVSRLPGHAVPRTHRLDPDSRFLVGMDTIIKILNSLEAVNDVERLRIINHASVTNLITITTTTTTITTTPTVLGVEYMVHGQVYREFGPVIMASGGFCGERTLVAKYRPDLAHLPTSSGEFADGRGLSMAEAAGAELVNMENIQMHALGLIDPRSPRDHLKYLAAECLRAEGAVLLDERWLVLNADTYAKTKHYVDHYLELGLIKSCATVGELSQFIHIPIELILDQIPISSSSSGSSQSSSSQSKGVYYVSEVTSVLHSSLGGVRITENGEVVSSSGGVVEGLFAAGEVAGGLFTEQRLLGTGLMAGVVFGRRAGKTACVYGSFNDAPITLAPSKPEVVAGVAPVVVTGVAPVGRGVYTIEQVSTHNRRDDCWIVVDGRVLDVTQFKQNHPGGELAILMMAGKDASKEFNMIHAADVIDKYAPETVIGVLASTLAPGVVAPVVAPGVAPAVGPREITKEEVSEHNKKTDLWVIVNGQVLDVTEFQYLHPGGAGPIQLFAGRDATKEFNMIHPEGVVDKYAKECIVGVLSEGPREAAEAGGLREPLLKKEEGVVQSQWWPRWSGLRTSEDYGVCGPSMASVLRGIWVAITLVVMEIVSTIFTVDNWKVGHSREGLRRSGMFLIFYVVVHAIGNLHVFFGPEAFNGYAYFLNHPTAWGTLALPVEIYLLLAALMHIGVGLLRTIKFKSVDMLWRSEMQGQLTLAITGLAVFVFLVVHLSQFRFPMHFPMFTFRTKWMYPFYCEVDDETCNFVQFKDLYKIQYKLFASKFWVGFYLFSVSLFVLHLTEGWRKVVAVSQRVARRDKDLVKLVGVSLAYVVGACYFAFPIYCYFWPVRDWRAYEQQQKSSQRAMLIEQRER